MRTLLHLAVLLGAFLLVTALALVLGAPDLGNATGFGQLAFALTLIVVLTR